MACNWVDALTGVPGSGGLHAAGMAMKAAQHKIVNLLKAFFFGHQFSLVFVYLMRRPRQLSFQYGLETPKG